MLKRWIFYLAALLCSFIFWIAHQGAVAWLLLSILFWLPWLSLLLSLIPMLTAKPTFSCPEHIPMGTADAQISVVFRHTLLLPPWQCRMQVVHTLTGEKQTLKEGAALPAAHCGQLKVSCGSICAFDYLGLFRLPLTKPQTCQVLVRPNKISMESPKKLERLLNHTWQPKPGGGFAENHEMRLYRPGDNLNQIHWKLTAKTGELMIREPMIPRHGRILLTIDICGTADELDAKFGKLLWMGEHLLSLNLKYEILALTGEGTLTLPVVFEQELSAAIDRLLGCSPVEEGSVQSSEFSASWHFHIGGEQDEA